MINPDYIKNYLIENKIIFPTNIHDGGQSGFQNYGPIGLRIKNNIINAWRDNFVCFDRKINIFEIDSPVVSSHKVLTRSGHVHKFNDLCIVFKDIQTNNIISVKRADHYVEEQIDLLKLDNQTYIEDVQFITNFLDSNNLYDKHTLFFEIVPISLMFRMENNGCTLKESLYLRPEIAQTIFVEFKQFYDYNNSRLPFGISQVGKSYRNEISDKTFVRLREFTQAEVEFFYNPYDKFDFVIPLEYLNKKVFILDIQTQIDNPDSNYDINNKQVNLSELDIIISNPIVRMFVFRLYLFAQQIGLDIEKLRFRQHKPDEKAHYANDCWDLEANIFGKWLEITGIADRGNYDLTVHDYNDSFKVKKSTEPIIKYKLVPKTKEIFKNYPKEQALEIVKKYKEVIISLDEKNNIDSNLYPEEFYNLEEIKFYEMITPSVVEPSLGIDRIFYSLIIHNLKIRYDTTRPYLLLPKKISPYDFALLQLSSHPDLINKLYQFINKLSGFNIFTDLSSTTIGKRYTRADELGINNCITIDFDTLKDNTVTIRNIYNMKQIRMNFDQINFHNIDSISF